MRTRFGWIACSVLALATAASFAQESQCPMSGKKASCQESAKASGGCSAKAAAANEGTVKAECEVNGKKVAYEMPAMFYMVGDEKTCCDKTAAQMAEKASKPVIYVVGEKKYEDRAEAMTAYAGLLDNYLENNLQVKYAVGDKCVACPMEAASLAKSANGKVQYRLASFTFDDEAKAKNALEKAKTAISKTGCSAACATKSGCCKKDATTVASKDSSTAASKDGEKAQCSAGEGKTLAHCCKEAEGKVELAKARIDLAMKTIAEVAGA